ncbi:hypothetical protein B0H19DRAFT_1261011 [Mycena capillaripes]|nr:hypothetical protein B0H19DRAFT_1261011 [Mycena capillaripes]
MARYAGSYHRPYGGAVVNASGLSCHIVRQSYSGRRVQDASGNRAGVHRHINGDQHRQLIFFITIHYCYNAAPTRPPKPAGRKKGPRSHAWPHALGRALVALQLILKHPQASRRPPPSPHLHPPARPVRHAAVLLNMTSRESTTKKLNPHTTARVLRAQVHPAVSLVPLAYTPSASEASSPIDAPAAAHIFHPPPQHLHPLQLLGLSGTALDEAMERRERGEGGVEVRHTSRSQLRRRTTPAPPRDSRDLRGLRGAPMASPFCCHRSPHKTCAHRICLHLATPETSATCTSRPYLCDLHERDSSPRRFLPLPSRPCTRHDRAPSAGPLPHLTANAVAHSLTLPDAATTCNRLRIHTQARRTRSAHSRSLPASSTPQREREGLHRWDDGCRAEGVESLLAARPCTQTHLVERRSCMCKILADVLP